MRKIKYVLSTGLLLAFAGNAYAVGELVLGDSLGVGVKIVSGHPGPARLSQFIRNDQILTQLSQVPNGATAILVLGTNDSAGSVKGLEKNIDNIVRAVEARQIKLVWVGPPCVRKSWDKNSRDLDAMLAARLASSTIKYISIRSDAALCSGQYTGGDGVHLNFAGYSLLWNKARVAAALPDSEDKAVKVAAGTPAAASSAAKPAAPARIASAADSRPQNPQRKKNQVARAEAQSSPLSGLFFWLRRSN